MAEPVAIAGAASRSGTLPVIEAAIRETVLAALADAGLGSLDEIDAVVTVGSDLLDGGMVATRSGLAGSYGRSLITVPSSSGHALAAAVAMIEAGTAGATLLVGWGEGSNFAEVDGRITQADPFYARPRGAGAGALAALQAQRLVAMGRVAPFELDRYVRAMSQRAADGGTGIDADIPAWLTTTWCDGVSALVLTGEAERRGRARIADFGTSFQPYCPEPDDLDPERWVATAAAAMRRPERLEGVAPVAVEVCGPTALAEATAVDGLLGRWGWPGTDPRVNATGGGSLAFYGPATGLRQVVGAVAALRAGGAMPSLPAPDAGRSAEGPATAVVVDLAGPIGQATTVIVLEGGAS